MTTCNPPRPAPDKDDGRHRLSTLFDDLVHEDERVSVADLTRIFQDRAFGALMVIFAIPNILPIPIPGITALTALPLLFLTGQLALGRRVPWLPRWIARRSFARAEFMALTDRIRPFLMRLERILRPRLMVLVGRGVERAVGVLAFFLATIVFLPIPLGNFLPALAICILGLAILERDGLALLAGVLIAIVSTVVAGGVVFAMIKATIFVLRHALQA